MNHRLDFSSVNQLVYKNPEINKSTNHNKMPKNAWKPHFAHFAGGVENIG